MRYVIFYCGYHENFHCECITPEKKAKKDAERSNSDVKTITAMGKESARFTATLVKPGDEIRIEFDVRQRDQYGRLLAG